jgi:hypothetical protein
MVMLAAPRQMWSGVQTTASGKGGSAERLPTTSPPATHAVFEATADAAVYTGAAGQGQAGGLVRAIAGPTPCCLIVEGVVIALADDADGMAVVRGDQVVRI